MSADLTLAALQELGTSAGFDAIGATTADDFPELIPLLKAYEQRGNTGFETGDISLRTRPKEWMPAAKSLIAVAMAYRTEEGQRLAQSHPKDPLTGRVTIYSYGEDYHNVMRERLKVLHLSMERYVGRQIEAQQAVDTSPLVDRRVAERAGIGWMGKNCLFYTPEHGSYVFLGTLAVDIEVEQSRKEQPTRCGSCSLCLTACPTGALIAPGVIDAQRCLSYVTQMKGIIPLVYRKAMGKRVWGCDTCQTVCPENQDVSFSRHQAYLPHGELEYPQLLEILTWSNREFARRYGRTAAAWRGVRTWQRNALIALGNCRRPEATPAIIPFLSHVRPELRASAAWALAQLATESARTATRAAWEVETVDEVRADMAWAVEERTDGNVGVSND